jgi:protein O-mannosyl-transferase
MKFKTDLRTFMSSRFFHPWFALTMVGLSAFIIYSNIYNSPFVFDDISSIAENKIIRDLSNFFSFEKLLKPRAIVNFTFALNYAYGKLDVFGYHLVNVLIHVLNGIVVYFLAITILKLLSRQTSLTRKTTIGTRDYPIQTIALFSSLLFVVHPIQTQAVTYTVQRYASIAAMFYMASVLFYLKARIIQKKTKSREHGAKNKKIETKLNLKFLSIYTLSVLCGMLAFLSKQNTASLPGTILLVEYLLIDRTWQGWKKKLPVFFLAFGLWILFVLYISGLFGSSFEVRGLLEDVSGMIKETKTVSRWQYLCTQFNVLVIYLRLLFIPINQNLDYFYPFKLGFFDGLTPLAFIFLTSIACLGLWSIKKHPVVTFSIFWFFITLSVESSIIPISDAIFEHRLYLPMLGFGIIVSYLLFNLLSKQRVLAVIFLLVVAISLGAATYYRNGVWKNSATIWADVVSKSPKNPRGHNSYGIVMYSQGRMEKAIENYLAALRLIPDYEIAHNNIGLALYKQGRTEEAIKHYLQAIRKKPDYKGAHFNFGLALNKQGRFEEAIDHYLAALRLGPYDEKIHFKLGIALYNQGRFQKAIEHFLAALRILPNFVDARNYLGTALFNQGRNEEAIKQYLLVLQKKPDHEIAHNNIGLVLYKQGSTEEAIKHYLQALRKKPDYKDAQINLGIVLNKQGRFEEAIEHYFEALRMDPYDEKAHTNLGIALYHQGRFQKAFKHLIEAIQINPDFGEAHHNLGIALYKQRRTAEAIKHYFLSLRLNPDNVDTHYNLGVALYSQDRLNEAIEHYLQTLRLNPDHADACNNLGVAYFNNGNINKAIAQFREALRINSDHLDASKNIEKVLAHQGGD